MAADVSDLHRALGRIEGLVEGIDAKIDGMNGTVKHHDDRIREVESAQSRAAGRQSVIGSIAGLIGGALAAWFGRHF